MAWVGREEFFAGLRRYFDKHAWSNTELSDLLDELEATVRAGSGHAGRSCGSRNPASTSSKLPSRAESDPAAEGNSEVITRLQVTQRPWEIAGQPTPSLRPHRLAIGFYSESETGRMVRTHSFSLDIDSESAEVVEAEGLARPDVIVVNDADLSYAKVRFDAHSMDTAAKRLSDFDDSLTQLLILATLWDEVRDGERPVHDYIDTITAHLGAITHSSGLLTQMRQLETAVSAYLPPQQREAMHARLADRFFELLETVDEGTDQAFQFVQGFVKHATTTGQLDRLRSWLLPETERVHGIAIDTDLSWDILVALCAHDGADEAALEAMSRKDPSATGVRRAATAACLPADDGGEIVGVHPPRR